MAKATLIGGQLVPLKDCYVVIPGTSCNSNGHITLVSLPDISDGKAASYSDETVMGRSNPLKTYSHSDNRTISMQLHFYVTRDEDISQNLCYLKALESAVYPRSGKSGLPFIPPPVCQIKCGSLLSSDENGDPGDPLCVVLRSYSVKFPVDVAWDEDTYLPYKFDVDTSWEVVYSATNLPGAEMIMELGA